MFASERHVRMAQQLYDARRAVRTLLGEQFKPRMAAIGSALKSKAAESGSNELSVAIEAARNAQESEEPYVALQFLAAAVELTEPST